MADGIILRELADDDLPVLFEHQVDPAANHMAAFTADDPSDRDRLMTHWARIRADPCVTVRAIVFREQVAGYVASFNRCGAPEVSYWLGKEYWGRGIATTALMLLLDLVVSHPLYARVARDNAASIRVLEKCGFIIHARERAFANARQAEIDELILVLTAHPKPTTP